MLMLWLRHHLRPRLKKKLRSIRRQGDVSGMEWCIVSYEHLCSMLILSTSKIYIFYPLMRMSIPIYDFVLLTFSFELCIPFQNIQILELLD